MVDKAKVLVADDDKDIRFLIHMYLRDYDVDVLEVSDGKGCLEISRTIHPQLVILNYMLDNVTGYQVAEELSKEESLKNIPVIMMILEGFDLIEEKAGIDDYLAKPFSRDQFTKTLIRVMGDRIFPKIKEKSVIASVDKTKKKKGENKTSVRKRILVADDDLYIIKMLKIILEKNYDLDFVNTGEELVEKASSKVFDLIISDVIMPKMSGWKSMKKLRESGCNIPVIFDSGLVKDKELYETLKPGGPSRFILKPFNKNTLLSAIKELIE